MLLTHNAQLFQAFSIKPQEQGQNRIQTRDAKPVWTTVSPFGKGKATIQTLPMASSTTRRTAVTDRQCALVSAMSINTQEQGPHRIRTADEVDDWHKVRLDNNFAVGQRKQSNPENTYGKFCDYPG